MTQQGRAGRKPAAGGALLLALVVAAGSASAGPREQARRIHDRLAGVPPSEAVLGQMASLIQSGDTNGAALLAMDNPAFYNVTLKNFVAPWTSRGRSVFVPLNDYTATVIGMVRDDVDFSTVLSADLVYTSNAPGAPAYSAANNDHYQYLDDHDVDLKATLVPQAQSNLLGIPSAATAGVITSRAASAAFFVNGTNRAMFRFTLMNHLCRDLEQVQDPEYPPDRIRQDVARSPGGDSRIFLNSCITCHNGMDPMAQAFAYYNFDDTAQKLSYTAGQVQPKYLINSDNFKPGYVTTDDHWNNYWRTGANSVLGFDTTGQSTGAGTGAKSLGRELATSDAFAQCQVEKVFRAVCFRDPGNAQDRGTVQAIKNKFKSSGYKLKQVFADAATYCMGS